MSPISLVAGIANVVLTIYFFLMLVRLVLDFGLNFSRNWRPAGLGLVLAEFVLTLTDPPIRLVRRVIPPLRMGPATLDFSWSIVMVVVIVLMYISLAVKSSVG